jgi:sterol desaturase/sphingolipid hydroxylase (fatty acid hydroxylase superfamily)
MIDLTVYAVPVFIATMIAEAAALRRRPEYKGYRAADTRASLTMGIVNVLINLAMKGVQLSILMWFSQWAVWHLDSSSWQTWVLGVFAVDFAYYWFHRSSHDVRLLWAAHINHHSSEHYNLSTALRQSWTTPFTGLPFYWPLALIGFDPVLILTLEALNTLYQYWIHTELIGRISWLEGVLNTASHHRVHHGTNIEYLDRNHAGIFIFWDRLFGTFEPEVAPVRYGLTKNIETFDPVTIAFHEFAAIIRDVRGAKSLRDALGYLFAPPGWSPDGSTKTSRQLRACAAAEERTPAQELVTVNC